VILEPNRRRRRRAFRALAGVVLVLFIGGLLATGWTVPAFSVAVATPSAPPAPSPTNAVAVVPTGAPSPEPSPSDPPPSPGPTPDAHGCLPPPPDIVPATVTSHGPRTDKAVALTFDDGNDSQNTEKILYILRSRGVNATFFPTARAVELASKTWRQVAAANYPIANHTYHHISLKGLCFQKQLAELEKAKSVIAAEPLPLQGYMRPPYEDFDDNTRLAATAAGESHVVLWDIDTFDWTGVGWRTVAARALRGHSGSIILMHTSAHASSTALYEIIKQFKKRGYRFVTVGQMLGIPGPVPFP
jgi:peptidoglycan-N-acetylglucosamine deacetylase